MHAASVTVIPNLIIVVSESNFEPLLDQERSISEPNTLTPTDGLLEQPVTKLPTPQRPRLSCKAKDNNQSLYLKMPSRQTRKKTAEREHIITKSKEQDTYPVGGTKKRRVDDTVHDDSEAKQRRFYQLNPRADS
jgi:hypothetical protein